MTLASVHKIDNAKSELRQRLDSFANATTGIGSMLDKRQGGYSQVLFLDYQQAANLYRGNDMAARIVDAPAEDMCRKGWSVEVEKDRDAEKKFAHIFRKLKVHGVFLQALKYARAYGGSGIFIGADDGQTADKQLDIGSIKKVDFLLPLDTFELVANGYYTNPLEPKYGFPSSYRLNRFGSVSPVPVNLNGAGASMGALAMLQGGLMLTAGQGFKSLQDWSFLPIVHESRIIRFEGVIVNRLQLRQQRYWGDSVLVRCIEVLRDFNLSWASASILLQDFAQAVIKLPGFGALLAKEGPKAFSDVANMVESSRSTARALFLDKDDEFARTATPVTGLDDLLVQFARRLAASADMPVTRLMGESPSGLNATGNVDQDWWYDKVDSKREEILRPALYDLCDIFFAAKDGPTEGKRPEEGSWDVHLEPLKQLNASEEAKRRFYIAQADALMVKTRVITRGEVAATRYGGRRYNADKIQLDELDTAKREENAKAADREAAALNQKEGGQPDTTNPGSRTGEPGPLGRVEKK